MSGAKFLRQSRRGLGILYSGNAGGNGIRFDVGRRMPARYRVPFDLFCSGEAARAIAREEGRLS